LLRNIDRPHKFGPSEEKQVTEIGVPPRTKITNRKMLRKAREALQSISPKERDSLRFNGVGPGESYIGMWRIVTNYRHRVAQIQGMMARPRIAPDTLRLLQAQERYLCEQIIHMYAKLLPHEKPKLSSIDLKGDPQNPPHNVDLSGLPDEDLYALARILPKIRRTNGPERDQSEAAGGPRGDTALEGAGHRAAVDRLRQIAPSADRSRRRA
jgi:hypothetical protein